MFWIGKNTLDSEGADIGKDQMLTLFFVQRSGVRFQEANEGQMSNGKRGPKGCLGYM